MTPNIQNFLVSEIHSNMPDKTFILADAGYALSNRVLTPFRSTRYHLKEFGNGNRPANWKELFNLRHSKLRNVIERTIAILKRRWRLLRYGSESLDIDFISKGIECCGLLHNVLIAKDDMIQDDGDIFDFNPDNYDDADLGLDQVSYEHGKHWRDLIAIISMWNSYVSMF